MSEHQLQVSFFIWSKLQASKYPDLLKMFAIPNGGARHIAVASKLKAEGVKAGVPDVFLPIARGGFHGLWIEFKVKPNKCHPAQLERIAQLRADGHNVHVCHELDEAINAVLGYLKQEATQC
jgi:hypothetical protein